VSYAGMVIGGPWAGKSYEGHVPPGSRLKRSAKFILHKSVLLILSEYRTSATLT